MKKIYELEDLDCAVCANKMEVAIKKIDGVLDCNVNFLSAKLMIEANDEKFEDVLKQVKKTIKKVEPDCRIK